jgi:hypothetical protein
VHRTAWLIARVAIVEVEWRIGLLEGQLIL